MILVLYKCHLTETLLSDQRSYSKTSHTLMAPFPGREDATSLEDG